MNGHSGVVPFHQLSRTSGGSFTTSPRPMSIQSASFLMYARAQVIFPGSDSPANEPPGVGKYKRGWRHECAPFNESGSWLNAYAPHEPEAWKEESSFFLGPSLYASPVVRRGATTKDLWLPPGRFVDLDDLATYEGDLGLTRSLRFKNPAELAAWLGGVITLQGGSRV